MPFTPYHFGPSGFVGLIFRKWIDLPVFVLANVVVDLEVLTIGALGGDWPYHRYLHTLLLGALTGIGWGLVAYRLRGIFKKLMRLFRLDYKTTLSKMIISGILGIWLHVLIDAVFHWDVNIFWPNKAKPLYKLLSQRQVETVCIWFWVGAIVLYGIFLIRQTMRKGAQRQ